MDRQTRTATAAIIGSAAVDANRYRVTIAANEEARQPPILDFDGLSLDNYMLNPVVMWAHDVSGRSPSGGLPIGRTLELAKTAAGQLAAEFEFLSDDPFARRVKNAWDKGFLRAASISWLPIETAPARDGGYRDTRSDLLEWSIVPVPSDPDALRESHARLLDEFLGNEHPSPQSKQNTLKERRARMATTDMEAIRKDLAEINGFVRERIDPVSSEVGLLREEVDRLGREVADVQQRDRTRRRDALARLVEQTPGHQVQEGPYAGMDILDLALVSRFARSQRRESFGPAWVERAEDARRALVRGITVADVQASHQEAARRLESWFTVDSKPTGQYEGFGRGLLQSMTRAAMDSTTAGYGDELVATLEARELWLDVNLQTLVAPLVPTFPMPSNPFDVPTQLGDVSFYPGTENVAAADTRLSTGKTTLTAHELVGQVPYSFTLEEDGVIAMLPEIRAGLVRNVAETLDDIILNADTTAQDNINADGATISASSAGKAQWLIGYDGILHLPLVDNSDQANDHGDAVSDDMFNELRAKLGKYGVRPSQLVWVMDVNTFIRAQGISQYRTMDKLGPNATLLTGMLGAIEGIPVIVSEHLRLADVDGKVTDAGNGTDTGRVLLFNRTQWAQGFRRQLNIDVDRDLQKRQTVVTVSFRHALTERSGSRSAATHTALQYNITGVA